MASAHIGDLDHRARPNQIRRAGRLIRFGGPSFTLPGTTDFVQRCWIDGRGDRSDAYDHREADW